MKNAKIIEAIGFVMLLIAFILKLFKDQGFFTSFSKEITTYFGLIGLILWSFAYSKRTKN